MKNLNTGCIGALLFSLLVWVVIIGVVIAILMAFGVL